MKSQVNEGTHKPPRKTGIKPVAAKPLKKKLTEAVSAKALANSFSRINVKVLKEPQNGNKPQTFEVNRNQKSVSTKVVVSKQNPQQKRPHEGSNSSIALLKPKTKSRKTKHQKKNEEVVLDTSRLTPDKPLLPSGGSLSAATVLTVCLAARSAARIRR